MHQAFGEASMCRRGAQSSDQRPAPPTFFKREIWPPRRHRNASHLFFQPKSSAPEPDMEVVHHWNRYQVFQDSL